MRRARLSAALLTAGLAVAPAAAGPDLVADCVPASARVDAGPLCALWPAALAEAMPGRTVRSDPGTAGWRLVVLRAGRGVVVARIDRRGPDGWVTGEARASLRADAPLDTEARRRLLATLIADSPDPAD